MENILKLTPNYLTDSHNPILISGSYDEAYSNFSQSTVHKKLSASRPHSYLKKSHFSPLDSVPPEDMHKF